MTKKFDVRYWYNRTPKFQQIDEHTRVVRDDLIVGGTKLRFLPLICEGADEVVFGTPFCGGAQVALAVMGRHTGQTITLFSAKRRELHRLQQIAIHNGAKYRWVSPGYMTVVQKRARDYAAKRGALFLPLGFDTSKADDVFCEYLDELQKKMRKMRPLPNEIWCATGSGMLARCLGTVFSSCAIKAVAVGLPSRHSAQKMPVNVQILTTKYRFEQECTLRMPFPSCPNYERKAWELMCAKPPSRHTLRLFWNVLG